MNDLPKPVIKEHEGFLVLRDDLLHGGTKRRVLNTLLKEVKKSDVVYPAHAFGMAGLALGLAGMDNQKKVTLFYPSPKIETKLFNETIKLPNVDFYIVDGATKQHEVVERAQKYAEEKDAHFMPIGFDFPAFSQELVRLTRSLEIKPEEVWVLGGSGTLARSLARAWPTAQINTVNLGMVHGDMGTTKVYDAPEKPEEPAEILPPYPSTLYYDAKIWRFVKKYGSRGAFIWNVS